MLKCEICNSEPQSPLMTRCCKLFICDPCRQKQEKLGVCVCGKTIANKRLCTPNSPLFEILKNYYEGRPQECDRCEKPAEWECLECSMVFCEPCNEEVHNGKGYAKHSREAYETEPRSHKKLLEKARKKEEWCKEHKLVLESICECGALLCLGCLKGHKEGCSRTMKTKTLKEYKEEYFSQVLFKIKQITEFKEKLQLDKKDYQGHFNTQKQLYDSSLKLIDEQLEGLKKLLELKTAEIKTRLTDYWKDCTTTHKKTEYLIDESLRKYDDLGRLSEKFVEKMMGYDYLEKRVKRFYINHEFFNFRLHGFEEAQFAIINMATSFKNWEVPGQDPNGSEAAEDKAAKDRKMDLNPTYIVNSNSQLLLECSQNPLNHRPLTLKASHNQVCFEFLHLPYQRQLYEIEYGVGLKMKGQEVFKRLQNKNGVGVISNLNPSTKYRVRMRVGAGVWGPISEIKTQESPKFNAELCISSKYKVEPPLQTLKEGIVYGTNEIQFGVHCWEVKIFPTKHNGDETACICIGVSNKEQKKHVVVGTTLNYGYQKAMIAVKVTLNCEENRMLISSTGNQDEIYQNLPIFPIFPVIQNKGSTPVQIQCIFL